MSSPPFTDVWDETHPAETDLANTLGSQGRQLKLDVRERLDWQHVFGQNVNDDGGHRFIAITSTYHPANMETLKARGYSLTGANTQGAVDWSGTWNTSGIPTLIKFNVTDTASAATAKLMDLQVGGVSRFSIDKAGNVSCASVNASPRLSVTAVSGTYSILGTDAVVACNGTFTVTLPTAVGLTGQVYYVKNVGTGIVTLATSAGQTIDGVATIALNNQYISLTVVSDGSNWGLI